MGVRNTLGDLNNHLFEQMERLNNSDLKGEDLKEEISRARSISDVATKIIDNGSLVLEAQKYTDNKWDAEAETPRMLKG